MYMYFCLHVHVHVHNVFISNVHVVVYILLCTDNRTIRETKMNTVSSRSHAIFSIIIESKESSDDIVQLSTLVCHNEYYI